MPRIGRPLDRTRRTALYRLYDSADSLLYVGIAFTPRIRWYQHAMEKDWWHEVARREVEWHATRDEAEAAELVAIRAELPRYNRAGVDERPAKWPKPTPAPRPVRSPELERSVRSFRRAQRSTEAAHERLVAAMRAARDAGVRQVTLVELTGYTREHVRRLLKD